MTYKGRRIGGGDELFDDRGNKYTISDWSEGTGDIYVHDPFGYYMNIERVPLPLSWDFPFISVRGHG